MNFFFSVFKNSKVGSVTRYGEAGPGPKGTVMSATFQLDGQDFFARLCFAESLRRRGRRSDKLRRRYASADHRGRDQDRFLSPQGTHRKRVRGRYGLRWRGRAASGAGERV